MKHYLGVCLVLVTIAAISFLGMKACTASVNRTVDHVRDAFGQVLRIQPKVTVNERVILTQSAPIAELAVINREELISLGLNEHLEVLSVQIPLTDKKVTAEAAYRIKAGFDLRQPFTVSIDPLTHAVKSSMPHATILSVEQIGPLTYHGEDAWLNRITDDERAQILTNLNTAARDAADQSTLCTEAEQQVNQRLQDVLNHNGQSFEIEWTGTPQKTLAPVP